MQTTTNFEGYLQKQSLYLKSFRKRWIVLKGHYLYSYKDHNQMDKATEVIDLSSFNYLQTNKNQRPGEFKLMPREFKIISKDATRSFIAPSIEDMNDWILYIKHAMFINHSILTELAKHKETNLIKININISLNTHRDIDVIVCASYSKQETIQSIEASIYQYLSAKYDTIKFEIYDMDGFVTLTSYLKLDEKGKIYEDHDYIKLHPCFFSSTPIITFNVKYIIDKGLKVNVRFYKYKHKIISTQITCQYMQKYATLNPLYCPIYNSMKNNYEWNEKNLNHLNMCTHFKDEFGNKSACKYKNECKAYIRLEKGGNDICDLCHIKLYRHPPRSRYIHLSENTCSLIIHQNQSENHPLYEPKSKKYFGNKLIEEVIVNGYRYDLCLECNQNDECKHDDYSILKIVDNKMNHNRHKLMQNPLKRSEMLSLILYTGGDCNYDLCAAQRNGDYNKWKWFDLCLYSAIRKLSSLELGSFSVFSGINKVKLDKKTIDNGYFVTYVSTSWNKEIAKSFLCDDGIIIQIDKAFKNNFDVICCDVSWISKFPDECEILFARSIGNCTDKPFKCTILDDSNGIQTISLSVK